MPAPSPAPSAARPKRTVRIAGADPALAHLITQALAGEGWTLSAAADVAAAGEVWLVQATSGSETDAAPILATLRAFAGSLAPDARGGVVLILDLSGWQPRAGETPPPFAPTLAQRTLAAAVPMLALEFAPRLRVNAIGRLPAGIAGAGATPDADIAAALRFVIDAPALTGQMIALDGGRTALVPAPGHGTPQQP